MKETIISESDREVAHIHDNILWENLISAILTGIITNIPCSIAQTKLNISMVQP